MANPMNPNKSSFPTVNLKIGDYQIYAIPTGIFALDGGAMFGTVPKVLWEKTNPSDEKNRIPMEARALLLVSNQRKILVDTGNGEDFKAKYGEKLGSHFSEMYGLEKEGPSLKKSLQQLGVSPSDITDVILTHLHFDHAGGATCEKDGQIVPAFENAKYYLQKKNLTTAQSPNKREQASYLKANFEPLIEKNQLVLLNENEVSKFELNNIRFEISDGHTEGHQCVIVEDDVKRLVYCGDVIPTSTHIRSAWGMGYDLNPLKLMDEKKKLLKLSEDKPTFYFFEHDPYCDMATIEPDRSEYKIKDKFWIKHD